MDLLEPWPLSWVNAKEGASDTGIFMRARGSVVATADAESDLPQLEVGQELLPLRCGKVAVFLAGPFGRRRAMNARW